MRTVQKKVCLLGNFAVGKTSLVRRFVEGRFSDKYHSTIGVKISRRVIDRETHKLSLVLWDLAGESNITSVNGSYLKGASGAIIVCDLTRANTLDAATELADLLHEVSPNAKVVLVGNKVDLTDERVVDDDTLTDFGSALAAPCFVTSAKDGTNVTEAFSQLADMLEAVA